MNINRRDFITAVGSFAAFPAIARPIRGVEASVETRFAADDQGSNQLAYIRDGLVAMWDGEFNDINAFGRYWHNPNAQAWHDLSGNGYTLTPSVVGYWKPFSLSCDSPKMNGLAYYGSVIPDVVQAEMICNVNERKERSGFLMCNGEVTQANPNNLILNSFVNGFQTSYACVHYGYAPTSGIYAVSATSKNLYSFGEEVLGGKGKEQIQAGMYTFCLFGRRYGTYNLAGDIFCVRLYSRELNEEERLWNYQIDQERFGVGL